MSRLLALVLAASCLQTPEAAPDADAKAELARHQGVWRTVSSRHDGEDADPDVVRPITREVKDDRVVWRRDGKSFSASTVVLDSKADPKTIDVRADGGPGRDKVVRGIYKLEDDRLAICTAGPDEPRPDAFRADPGDRWTLMVFKREPKAAEPRTRRECFVTPWIQGRSGEGTAETRRTPREEDPSRGDSSRGRAISRVEH